MRFESQTTEQEQMPLVSVYIPAYNGADFIAQTIQSVLDQTYQNIELVISDDCSTDNTVEIVQSFQDSRIRLIENKKNLGAFGNFAQCTELTHGAYLKILNDDDMLSPTAIEKAVHILQMHPEVSVVIGSSVIIGSDNETLMNRALYKNDYIIDGHSFARRTFRIGRNLYSETGMMLLRNDKELLRDFFSRDIIIFGVDWELGLELSYVGKVYYLADVVGFFRISGDSISVKSNTATHFRKHMEIFEEHKERGLIHLTAFDRIVFQIMVYANDTARHLVQRLAFLRRRRCPKV